jgi:hypothetical protein
MHPPIVEWDSCRIDKKLFIYTRNFVNDGSPRSEGYIGPGKPIRRGLVITQKDGRKVWRKGKEQVDSGVWYRDVIRGKRRAYRIQYDNDYSNYKRISGKAGVQIGYPLLLEYEGVVYGLVAIDYMVFGVDYAYESKYFLSKWSGEGWEILLKD